MSNPGERVLVVEDEPEINDLVCEVLAAEGMDPVPALDGEAGLAEAEASRPAAIVLDLMLPKLSGLDVCRRLKTDPATRAIPILVLTALQGDNDRRVAFEAGADDYMTKPFSPIGLVSRLEACLARARQIEAQETFRTTFDLTTSLAGLKALNGLVTALYCRTALDARRIEALRTGLVHLGDAAAEWAAANRGVVPVRLTAELGEEHLRLRFAPAEEDVAEAFLVEHLDPDALVPAGFTDAGIIDRQTQDGDAVVMETRLPPPA